MTLCVATLLKWQTGSFQMMKKKSEVLNIHIGMTKINKTHKIAKTNDRAWICYE